ncbi:MerR family DNA-binding transcriptional regulator [Nonomuraea sp. MTCD27]|uniref:MerR family DNA-binding transcriptional regulator n=1 Tax=Nonomuraea sp. MTCD27 TaxID=1676747 RepID=UPI0035C17483
MRKGVTIGQAAAFVGVTVKTVRHYHKLGLGKEPDGLRIAELAAAAADRYLANPALLKTVTGLQARTEAATRYTLIARHGDEQTPAAARLTALYEARLRAAGIRIPRPDSPCPRRAALRSFGRPAGGWPGASRPAPAGARGPGHSRRAGPRGCRPLTFQGLLRGAWCRRRSWPRSGSPRSGRRPSGRRP